MHQTRICSEMVIDEKMPTSQEVSEIAQSRSKVFAVSRAVRNLQEEIAVVSQDKFRK
jgi:hypothetical protein